MKKGILILIAMVLLAMTACSQQAAESDKDRLPPSELEETTLEALVNGNSEFALDLYQQLRDSDENLFYSPYSISIALAMTYAGARDTTAEQMADILHFLPGQEELHPAFNSLDNILTNEENEDNTFIWKSANALWGQEDYTFSMEFLDALAEYYGAKMNLVDFVGESEKARQTINGYISDETEERIKDLLPKGAVDALTRLVLTNAVYFKAEWLYQFNEDSTGEAPFSLLDGSTVDVPMMHEHETLNYYESDFVQAVELPYKDSQFSMVVLLPVKGSFTDFEDSLDVELLDTMLDGMERESVVLSLPKFEFTSGFSLKQALSEMGMTEAFSENADFSGMTGKKELFISDVFHKGFVLVDETGTEAAAATAVVMQLTAAPMAPVQFTADHPFIFCIRDNETGTLLFIGRVLNPLE